MLKGRRFRSNNDRRGSALLVPTAVGESRIGYNNKGADYKIGPLKEGVFRGNNGSGREFNLSQKKRPNRKIGSLKEGGDLLSHRIAVPSAQTGLTSLFGMVRGEPRRYNHLNFSIPAKAGISVEYP